MSPPFAFVLSFVDEFSQQGLANGWQALAKSLEPRATAGFSAGTSRG